MPRTMTGGCHCGRVRFRVTADLARITECNCSICTKKGFLHLIVPPEQFKLLSGADALTIYRFNTGTAKHTFCSTCGIHAFYVPRSDQAAYVRRKELGAIDGRAGTVEVGRTISLDGEIRDGRHVFIVRVYYEDTDFTGIVYHD